MTKLAKAASIAGMLILASTTVAWRLQAAEPGVLGEGRAAVTELGKGASAITYWVNRPDGWHVVTTVDTVFGLDSDAESHAVVRFSAVLLPGQCQLISVPGPIGEPQQVLRIRRRGDQIEVLRLPASAV